MSKLEYTVKFTVPVNRGDYQLKGAPPVTDDEILAIEREAWSETALFALESGDATCEVRIVDEGDDTEVVDSIRELCDRHSLIIVPATKRSSEMAGEPVVLVTPEDGGPGFSFGIASRNGVQLVVGADHTEGE